jgi:hypothetical protein
MIDFASPAVRYEFFQELTSYPVADDHKAVEVASGIKCSEQETSRQLLSAVQQATLINLASPHPTPLYNYPALDQEITQDYRASAPAHYIGVANGVTIAHKGRNGRQEIALLIQDPAYDARKKARTTNVPFAYLDHAAQKLSPKALVRSLNEQDTLALGAITKFKLPTNPFIDQHMPLVMEVAGAKYDLNTYRPDLQQLTVEDKHRSVKLCTVTLSPQDGKNSLLVSWDAQFLAARKILQHQAWKKSLADLTAQFLSNGQNTGKESDISNFKKSCQAARIPDSIVPVILHEWLQSLYILHARCQTNPSTITA